jgi:phage tail sheath protein FI
MPEYLAPGVYIEEVSSQGQSIEGVSTSTAEFLGTEFISKLRQIVIGDHHSWGGQERCDASVHVLELCAWLTERVVARVNQIPDDGVPHAARLAAAALSLIVERKLPIGSAFKRTRFCQDITLAKMEN